MENEIKILDMNNPNENIRYAVFPDGQPHVNLKNISPEHEVCVICSITNCVKMIQLLEVSNALDNLFVEEKILIVPYLMGARSDRSMGEGDSVDLKVIANMINGCNFKRVYLYDVHSEVALQLINKSINISNKFLVEKYNRSETVLICPDAGASKKVDNYLKWNKNFIDVVYCTKTRNLQTGEIKLKVLEPEKCRDEKCIIIDDICDGGATFIAIAKEIHPKALTLIVTHGIFSKGFNYLNQYFDKIMTTDSYSKNYEGYEDYNSSILEVFPFPVITKSFGAVDISFINCKK